MSFTSAREFLEALLRDEVPTPEDLRVFLDSKASDEGLFLDFKHAKELEKPPKARNFTLQQYVAAFANSEGGVLVIGVEDKTKDFAPITDAHTGTVGGDLKAWAARTVGHLIGALGVPPRFATVDVEGGQVLLVVVHRAPTLVSITGKNGQSAYYFRIEDEAREVPASLVADLVLGRRQIPHLTVTPAQWTVQIERFGSLQRLAELELSRRGPALRMGGRFLVRNDSLVTAERVMAGLIAWRVSRDGDDAGPALSPDLLGRIDPVTDKAQHPQVLFHAHLAWPGRLADDSFQRTTTLRPFAEATASLNDPWLLEYGNQPREPAQVAAALYLLPEGCEPLWFQVCFDVYGKPWHDVAPMPISPEAKRTQGARPEVRLRQPKAEA